MDNKELLKEMIKGIPELPGIYKMLDARGNIIYIGKSKCLKKRVQSYFTGSPKWEKVKRMVSMIHDIDYIVTDTHLEARLLECSLIKELKPRFNSQMKNDKSYVFIRVETYNHFRSLSVVGERDLDCFGPFRSKYRVSKILEQMRNIYPISVNHGKYELEYHLFPTAMDKDSFELNRNILLELFREDNIPMLIDCLQTKLEKAASLYQYELASIYRDLIQGLTTIKNGLDGYKNLSSKDILLKLPLLTGYKLFYVSKGYLHNSRIVASLTEKEILDFILESRAMSTSYSYEEQDEKSRIDFRDILYSEISDLPEDMIEFVWV